VKPIEHEEVRTTLVSELLKSPGHFSPVKENEVPRLLYCTCSDSFRDATNPRGAGLLARSVGFRADVLFLRSAGDLVAGVSWLRLRRSVGQVGNLPTDWQSVEPGSARLFADDQQTRLNPNSMTSRVRGSFQNRVWMV
jgi:hypothetical protein